MQSESVRVLLADDSDIMRKAIRTVLWGEPKIALLGEARDIRQTIKMALTLRPTVILLDLRMPQEQGSTPSMVRAALLKATDRIVAMSMATDGDASGAANEN